MLLNLRFFVRKRKTTSPVGAPGEIRTKPPERDTSRKFTGAGPGRMQRTI